MQTTFSSKRLYLEGDENLGDLPSKAEKLFEHQLKDWKLAADGYRSLAAVQIKLFEFDNFTIEAHYNPGRIISSSAKVDSKSIQARPCFLCINNLPAEQKAVKVVNDYILLVNPFPIFSKHFTIPSVNHLPQAIESEINNMLLISSMLGKDYSVFYNGPRCGASAPDHIHFQAGNFAFMKIDSEFENISKAYGKIVYKDPDLITTAVSGCLRNFISIESNNISSVKAEFQKVYNLLSKDEPGEEPMMNIICTYNERWRLLVFPRSQHRPSYFFEEGEHKMLISPAAVDLGGVLIFPREEDFNKLTKELVIDIFRQVTFSDDKFRYLSDNLRNG